MKTVTLSSGKMIHVAEPGDKAPGLVKLAVNFTRDMAQIVQGAANGQPIINSNTVRESNLAICRANTCGFYSPAQGRCLHPDCGCFCTGKTLFSALACPLKLW